MEEEHKNSPNIGDLPDGLHSIPVDRDHHWTVLDQTKAEFKKSGRSGVILIGGPETEYREKVNAYLAKYGTPWDFGRDYLVIEHAKQARELFNEMKKAGLRVELILAGEPQND